MTSASPIQLHPLSLSSLHVRALAETGAPLAEATAFVSHDRTGRPFLLTARHIVTGRHQDTGQPLTTSAATPHALEIDFNLPDQPGSWTTASYALFTKHGQPTWLEHPTAGSAADVVALPIHGDTQTLDLGYAYDAYQTPRVPLRPTRELQVIGFPVGSKVGQAHGACAIWCRGTVVSEPLLDWNLLPCFLIDTRSRSGQSGSPVVAYQDGTSLEFPIGQQLWDLVGVYTGRIHRDSDLGIVWKIEVVQALLNHGRQPGTT